MKAVRLHPNSDTSNPYSAENPAPPSALVLDSNLPIPELLKPGELLVHVEATTVVRDSLTWPETYLKEYLIPGYDYAGTVVAVEESSQDVPFKVGDEIYGMAEGSRGGMWSEYAITSVEEAALKPTSFTWAQAAAVPMSALTAYQAIFEKAGVTPPNFLNAQDLQALQDSKNSSTSSSVLVTGASGAVGLYVVQLAKLAGLHVVAATRSNARNKDFLTQLGADEVVEYNDLSKDLGRFEIIIDTVGGKTLENCWSFVKGNGTLVSIHSASYDYVEEHRKRNIAHESESVKAVWFVVSASSKDLEQVTAALDLHLLVEPFVACVMPLAEVQSAYNMCSNPSAARGKIVLTTGAVSKEGPQT